MKKLLLSLLLLVFLFGCTTGGAMVQRVQLDACKKYGLSTLVFKDKHGVTYGIICTVPDSEADHVIEVEILSEVISTIKGN